MVMTVAAMAHALRHQLRGSDARADLVRCLGEAAAQVAARRNVPAALLQQAGQGLGDWLRAGRLDPQLAATMENRLAELTACAAGCERIASTPIPLPTRCCCTAPPTSTASCCLSAWWTRCTA
jgi:putative membrane protein